MTYPPDDGERPPQPIAPGWWAQPGQGTPAYGTPGHGTPGHGTPGHGTPGYGVPGYGAADPFPAPPAAPRRRRSPLVLVLGVLVVIVVVLALVGTVFGSTSLRPDAVQQAVGAQFMQAYGVRIRLGCPDDMAVEQGARYVCSGVTDRGAPVRVEIRITRVAGAHYEWRKV